MPKTRTIALAPVLAVLAGCSAPVSAPPPRLGGAPAAPRDQLALVLPSQACVSAPESFAEYSSDYARRDASLSVGTLTGALGPAYYQGEPAPSIDDMRWFYLGCDPRRVTYFMPEHGRRRGWR